MVIIDHGHKRLVRATLGDNATRREQSSGLVVDVGSSSPSSKGPGAHQGMDLGYSELSLPRRSCWGRGTRDLEAFDGRQGVGDVVLELGLLWGLSRQSKELTGGSIQQETGQSTYTLDNLVRYLNADTRKALLGVIRAKRDLEKGFGRQVEERR